MPASTLLPCRALLVFAALAGPVFAQSPSSAPPARVSASSSTATEAMLVKNALTAANHAIITGNFTVLRDLGSSSFRQRNSAADLALIFKGLKDRKVDLSPILNLEPQFTEPPTIDQAGYLRLVGFFPTQPLQVRFAIAYQRIEAGLVIDTISVGTVEPHPQPPVAVESPRSTPPNTATRPPQTAPPQAAPTVKR